MQQPQWQIEHPRGVCVVSGRKLTEGEEFYTVLFEEGESFRRADYALESWAGPPNGSYCHFKTRVPIQRKRKRLLVDDDLLVNFFLRLGQESEPIRVQFRFVLALILMRKRRLRFEASSMTDGVETWQMTGVRDQSKHRVVNPHLAEDQVAAVSGQLSAILHGDMGEWTEELAESAASDGVENEAHDQVP